MMVRLFFSPPFWCRAFLPDVVGVQRNVIVFL